MTDIVSEQLRLSFSPNHFGEFLKAERDDLHLSKMNKAAGKMPAMVAGFLPPKMRNLANVIGSNAKAMADVVKEGKLTIRFSQELLTSFETMDALVGNPQKTPEEWLAWYAKNQQTIQGIVNVFSAEILSNQSPRDYSLLSQCYLAIRTVEYFAKQTQKRHIDTGIYKASFQVILPLLVEKLFAEYVNTQKSKALRLHEFVTFFEFIEQYGFMPKEVLDMLGQLLPDEQRLTIIKRQMLCLDFLPMLDIIFGLLYINHFKKQLGIPESIPTETLKELGDVYFEKITFDRGLPLSVIPLEQKEVGMREGVLTFDTVTDRHKPYHLAFGRFISRQRFTKNSAEQNRTMADSRSNQSKHLVPHVFPDSFAFFVSKTGEIATTFLRADTMKSILGEHGYQALRVQILYYLASITNAEYIRVWDPDKAVKALGEGSGGDGIMRIPRSLREINMFPQDQSPWTTREVSAHEVESFTRILPAGMIPSEEAFLRAKENNAVLHAVVMNRFGVIQKIPISKEAIAYEALLHRVEKVKQEYKEEGTEIRFQTYVKGHSRGSNGENPDRIVRMVKEGAVGVFDGPVASAVLNTAVKVEEALEDMDS